MLFVFSIFLININEVKAESLEFTTLFEGTTTFTRVSRRHDIEFSKINDFPPGLEFDRVKITLLDDDLIVNDVTEFVFYTRSEDFKVPATIDFEGDSVIYASITEENIYHRLRFNGLLAYNNSDVLIEFQKVLKPYESNVTNLNYELINKNDVEFNYNLPTDENFSHLEVYQDGIKLMDNVILNKFRITNLEFNKKYEFTIFSISKDGQKSSGIDLLVNIPENPNLVPSGNIYNLQHTVTDSSITFNYNLPLDDRFSHLKIYRDNELINDDYKLTSFVDRNLDFETEYSYRFVSVNKELISNHGYEITVKTNEENDNIPPDIPTNLTAKPMNSGIILNWDMNTESDLNGYFIFVNGKKINSAPIKNNFYNLTNLNNDEEYSLTVTAVDTSDNESEQSVAIKAIPTVENLPIFKLDTNLSSVVHSVENWFSEIWVLVAFAVSIPLAFVIGRRVKSLFIA